ncbi:chymotrypsinogen A-like [Dreissena polymorpha]|uniref:Peptidase S1 domain-containing protein n=1 Tax=Dreissena polymorpha TaxID=45954 RepID=A0A9D4C0M7_DREPO|nr:chymotrypsinogen A-like [Dreissena polymorpha]KAH3714944.1 hypothetical protein DPMN_057647 [Dreissena polymorpha]
MKLIVLLLCVVFAASQSGVPCGVSVVQPITKRLVGGQVAIPGSWPWMVLVTDSLGYIYGSGSIIDQHVILTSAHIFHRVFENSLHRWRIYAGEHNISTVDPHEKAYYVRGVEKHPGFNITSLENDIALIITVDPIAWNDATRPVCLPDAMHGFQVGENCYLAGWGSTKYTGNDETLNQLMMPKLDDNICASHWNDYLPVTEICAGYENQQKDFCVDDVGGPLVCKKSDGAWYVEGIASSGGDCSQTSDSPGVFEDVTQYKDWILNAMRGSGYPYQY